MSRSTVKVSNEREMKAVILNKNEERLLKKTFKTLDMEKTYVFKMIGLGDYEMRGRQQRLQEKVSKIKSFLTEDQIEEFMQMERDGTIRPATGSFHNTLRIESAANRLNLQSGKARPKSAIYRRNISASATGNRLHATLSVPVFRRPKTAMGLQTSHSSSDQSQNDMNDVTDQPQPSNRHLRLRPSTTPVNKKRASLVNRDRCDRPHTSAGLGYSSHTSNNNPFLNLNKEETETDFQPFWTSRRQSLIRAGDSLANKLAKARANERRFSLIQEEHERGDCIDEKIQHFLSKADGWVNDTPPDGTSNTYRNAKDPFRHTPRSVTISRDEQQPTNQNQGEEVDQWKGLNRCRYLRISDDDVDLTGLNTLAKDQMKLYSYFRKNDTILDVAD